MWKKGFLLHKEDPPDAIKNEQYKQLAEEAGANV
jgi:hypothetical protein